MAGRPSKHNTSSRLPRSKSDLADRNALAKKIKEERTRKALANLIARESISDRRLERINALSDEINKAISGHNQALDELQKQGINLEREFNRPMHEHEERFYIGFITRAGFVVGLVEERMNETRKLLDYASDMIQVAKSVSEKEKAVEFKQRLLTDFISDKELLESTNKKISEAKKQLGALTKR